MERPPGNQEFRWIGGGLIVVFVCYALYITGDFLRDNPLAREIIALGGAIVVVATVPTIAIIVFWHMHKTYEVNEVSRRRIVKKKKED